MYGNLELILKSKCNFSYLDFWMQCNPWMGVLIQYFGFEIMPFLCCFCACFCNYFMQVCVLFTRVIVLGFVFIVSE
jgi:hypothetical protein